ncbi:hypothetical protein MB84_02280 [Pandoraea oxalativorans]|uniref:OmpA-like domain-containing protein n=1 Tax=Pandoraea oxalativorans TaxID=573737 RepID=A0A0E3Y9Y4_9BURK|nr:hypothetical protein MB84_02280 [Pandoraea oxalativorans]
MNLRGATLAFAAVLTLAVLWLVSPFETGVSWLLTTVIVAVAVAIFVVTGRWGAVRHEADDGDLSALREALGRMASYDSEKLPLVLVVGDGLPALFDRYDERRLLNVAHGAIWVRVDRTGDLAVLALVVQRCRGGVLPDAVLVSVAPSMAEDVEDFRARLGALRQSVADTSRVMGLRLPVYVAIYQRLTRGEASPVPDWFGVVSDGGPIRDEHFSSVMRAAMQQGRAGADAHSPERAATLSALMPWSRRFIDDAFTTVSLPSAPVVVTGLAWVDAGPAGDAHGLWEREVAHRTGVHPASATALPQPWPFGHPLIGGLRRRRGVSSLVRALVHGGASMACACALAFWAAGHNNAALLAQVERHLAAYAAVAPESDAAKRDALQRVIDDRNTLERHLRLGVPLELSFGLHRGALLLPTLNRAIASYVPPPPLPSIVSLDSMALFETGKATLKPGSTRVMVEAVEMIKSHAGKRVLIAGYTDDVGSPAFNLKLSTARAEAVRDWLVEASGLPRTQFAIQGYGETRPIAGNDDAEGRAKNRRVEITLVPDTGFPSPT